MDSICNFIQLERCKLDFVFQDCDILFKRCRRNSFIIKFFLNLKQFFNSRHLMFFLEVINGLQFLIHLIKLFRVIYQLF